MIEIEQLVAWARKAFPYSGPVRSGRAPQGRSQSWTAAHNVAAAYSGLEAGVDEESARYLLGIGLNGLAATLRAENKLKQAVDSFRVAYGVLTSVHPRSQQPQHFVAAIGYTYANLDRLGVVPAEGASAPPLPEQPYLDIAALLADGAGLLATSSERPVDQGGEPTPTTLVGVDTLDRPQTLEAFLGKHPSVSSSRIGASAALSDLLKYLATQLGKSGILGRDIGGLLTSDKQALTELLTEGISSDTRYLQEMCRLVRGFAHEAGRDQDVEHRRRWLLASTMNHTVWRLPMGGLQTNEPQVQIDLMGYMRAVLIDHRYIDADRDLLLDCAECIVRLARNMKPVVFSRFTYLRDWVLAAAGTYLLLAGPSPSTPADSYYDERVQSESAPTHRGLQREKRPEWPKLLLAQWQREGEVADGACYALAFICGWEATRANWLIEVIYQDVEDGSDLAKSFWLERLGELMGRADRVRITANPWNVQDETASRGSMVLSDAGGRFVIPNPVLRAAAAQAVTPGEFITVHGQPFAGRRVPTYLLTNRFGPFAILKIDYREKIRREVENFNRYARRLHQSHRPSDCVAHPMDMYLAESGEPLRAIETSYVFEDRDQPLTLGTWLKSEVSPENATATVDSILLRALRPWLAHVRRDRIDLRSEYPVVRPAPAPDKQFPDNWADTELRRLEDSRLLDLGFQVDRSDRQCNWLDNVEGGPTSRASLQSVEFVNPLWLASEIAELGSGELALIFNSFQTGVRDFDTLLSLCHGDLHLDNILCATPQQHGQPRTVLIDFESAHEGHICKDLARLEASLLAQTFDWSTLRQTDAVVTWFCKSLELGKSLFDQSGTGSTREVLVATSLCAKLRSIVQRCGQGLWPIRDDEYVLALFCSLLPIARYTTLSARQRGFALLLATIAGSALLKRWETDQ